MYTGCNVESSSYPVTLCAERNAAGTAVAAGETAFVAVAVASPSLDLDDLTPCGMCRQFLAEFGEDTVIVYRQGGGWKAAELRELLPGAFSLGAG